jgi:hypothetical protein
MARPKGYRLNRPAFFDLIRAKRLDMSEVARLCHPTMPLTSLSDVVNGKCGASMQTVRRLCEALECEDETLFPELGAYMLRAAA